MSWEGQILIWDKEKKVKEWKSIRCTGRNGYIYRYPTRRQAEYMLDSCYPGCLHQERRTIEVEKDANIDIY